MKAIILFLTLANISTGYTQSKKNEPYDCESGGIGMNLTYVLSPLSNGQYRMDVRIIDPFSEDITGSFILSDLNDYGLRHFRGEGDLSNGDELIAEITVDYGIGHQLILTGFSYPSKWYSITFGCR